MTGQEEYGVQGATILAKGKATDLSLRTENHLGNWLLLFSLLDNGLNFGYDLDRRNAFDSTRLTNVWLASLAHLPAIRSSSTRLPTAGRGNTIALLTSKRSLHLVSVVVYLDVIDCGDRAGMADAYINVTVENCRVDFTIRFS